MVLTWSWCMSGLLSQYDTQNQSTGSQANPNQVSIGVMSHPLTRSSDALSAADPPAPAEYVPVCRRSSQSPTTTYCVVTTSYRNAIHVSL